MKAIFYKCYSRVKVWGRLEEHGFGLEVGSDLPFGGMKQKETKK